MGGRGRFPSFILKLCRASDGRPMTHSSLNGIAGGKVHVPLEEYERFLQRLAQFYANAENDPSNDIIDLCERIDTNNPFEMFHFHLDIDFGDELLAPHPMELRNLVRSVVFTSLPDHAPIQSLRKQCRAAMKRTDANNQHLHFFGLKVNRLAALYLHSRVLNAITNRFGCISDSNWGLGDGRYWNRILDNGYNGLRMLGSQKRHKDDSDPTIPRDLSNVYCVVDETDGDRRRFPPTLEDFKQTSIFALQHHVDDPSNTSFVFYEFKISPEPDFKVLDVIGLQRSDSRKTLTTVRMDAESMHRHIEEYMFPNCFPFQGEARKTVSEKENNQQDKVEEGDDEEEEEEEEEEKEKHQKEKNHYLLELFRDYDERPVKKRLQSNNGHTEEQSTDPFELLRNLHSPEMSFQGGLDSVTCAAHETALLLAEYTDFFDSHTSKMLLGIKSTHLSTESVYFMKPSRFWIEIAHQGALPLAVSPSHAAFCQNVFQQLNITIPSLYQMTLHLIPYVTFPIAKTYRIEDVTDLITQEDMTSFWSSCEAKQCVLIEETMSNKNVFALQAIAPLKAIYIDSVVASMPLVAFILPRTYVTLTRFLDQVKEVGIRQQIWDGFSGNVFQEETCACFLAYLFRIFSTLLEVFAPFQIGDIALDTILIYPNGMVYLNRCECNEYRRRKEHFYYRVDADLASPLTNQLIRTLQCVHTFLRCIAFLLTPQSDICDSIQKPDSRFDDINVVIQWIKTHFYSSHSRFSYVHYLTHCLSVFGEQRFYELKQTISENGPSFDLGFIFSPNQIDDFFAAKNRFLQSRLGQETMQQLFSN